MKYASFLRRALASVFDLAVINIAVMVLADVVMTLLGMSIDQEQLQQALAGSEQGQAIDMNFMQDLLAYAMALSVISVIVVVIVDAVLPATKLMASPGKAILGMVIVDADSKRLRFGKSFGRHSAKFVSLLTVFGFLMPLWDKKRQALHDKICATYVVKKRSLEKV